MVPDKLLTAPSYSKARKQLLLDDDWRYIALLGPRAFRTPMYDLGVELLIGSRPTQVVDSTFRVSDVSKEADAEHKEQALVRCSVGVERQDEQLRNPDHRVAFGGTTELPLLAAYADSYYGIGTGDFSRYGRLFWELSDRSEEWIRLQGTVGRHEQYGGRQSLLRWEGGKGALSREPNAFIRNTHVWGAQGVLVSLTGSLWCTRYTGEAWDSNCAPIIPRASEHLSAIWAFCTSGEFAAEVRRIDRSVKVMNHTLLKIPFDVGNR